MGHDEPDLPQLDDEERAYRASLETLVDWVRVEPRFMFARAFGPALLLVPAGGALVAAVARRIAFSQADLAFLLSGLVLIALGPLWALFSLIRAMGQDAYVAIREDGLGLRLLATEPERLVPWEQLEDARAEAGVVALTLTSGERLSVRGPFAGVTEDALARRIRDARRLAVWHMLTPSRLHGQRVALE